MTIQKKSYFKDQAAEFVYMRTYSRWRDQDSRRETWEETVDRLITFLKEERGEKLPTYILPKLRTAILNHEVLPSMRLMWSAGEAAKHDNTCLYNCAFISIKRAFDFGEALYILMCGTGVGFSVNKVHLLPEVPVFNPVSMQRNTFQVEDSKKGWKNSLDFLINSLYEGKSVDFDYSLIRPQGARLKTMGGRASGPLPLIKLHNFFKETFGLAQGRRLTTLEVHDLMCEIAEVVVVGGVRRSSLISLSPLNDEDMRSSKNWPFPIRRAMANNSAIYETKPSVTDFMDEWKNLILSGSGERGIFNLEAARKTAPTRRWYEELIEGTNPCVIGSTEVLTREGYKRIDSLVDTSVDIWNGFEWSNVTPVITGIKQKVLKLTFSDGRELICTPYHKFHLVDKVCEAKDLSINDRLIKHDLPLMDNTAEKAAFNAYAQGFKSADGMDNYNFLWLYPTKYMCLHRLGKAILKEKKTHVKIDAPHNKDYIPFDLGLKDKLDWLAGLLDGDGCELKEGGLQLVSIDQTFLLNLQKLLTTLGIQSKITLAKEAENKLMPDGRGAQKLFACSKSWRILIGAMQTQQLKDLGLKCERLPLDKSPNRDASRFVTVTSIEDAGIADKVYCFTEPKRNLALFNGVITGQCGEISLRDKQFCNLTTVIVRPEDDMLSLQKKVELATILGTIQSSFTHFPNLSPNWKKNTREEALLGVSLCGQMDNQHLLNDAKFLSLLKKTAIKANKKWSKILEVSQSVAITTGKPDGTTSQITTSGSGCHPWFAPYFIRRYRISKKDPLVNLLLHQGLSLAPENGQEAATATTLVVSFPVKAPEGAITRSQVSAISQLEWYKLIKDNYCEHNQSITVYVKDEEWLEVGNWVYKNWNIVNGVSFLPYDNGSYQQAPYEEISKETYEKMVKNFPKIDYSLLSKFETQDEGEGNKTFACVGDKCELP